MQQLHPNVPQTPFNLKLTSGVTLVNLEWEAVEGVDNYNIYRNGNKIAEVAAEYTTYKDTKLYAGTEYVYLVKTVIDGIESAESLEVSISTKESSGR
ncbi:hypothetical protein EP04_01945 [Listeria monocytogenes]|nr:hypothetical protein [Listeria monocytogenes]